MNGDGADTGEGGRGGGGGRDGGGEGNRDGDGGLVLLEYVDLHGERRGGYVPESEWERAVERGVGFGSVSLDYTESRNGRAVGGAPSLGPATGEIAVVADPESRVPVPWVDPDHERAACRIRRDGEPSPLCSRTTLERVADRLADAGYAAAVGTEYEFLLCAGLDPEGIDREGGDHLREAASSPGRPYGTRPATRHAGFLDDLRTALDRMGIAVETLHKESPPGVHEVVLGHSAPVAQADAVTRLRAAARGVGAAHGLTPSFMPRPFGDAEGAGQHFHVSLRRDGANAFADPDDDRGLSALARQFVAGVLAHADGLTPLCAPTVNSYRRLRPNLWAPVDASYGFDNKTCLVRVPPERGERTRVEVRLPDSFANPYLALAGVLAAGLDGVERELDPGPPTTENVFERSDAPADRVPATLDAALDALAGDETLADALGSALVDQYVRLKRAEIERFRSQVTDWEVREYADRL